MKSRRGTEADHFAATYGDAPVEWLGVRDGDLG
jgi:hypothetical protein